MAAIAASLSGRGSKRTRSGALMPSFTFPATAQAALWGGLRPRLIDIDPNNWHLDPSRLERVLGSEAHDIGIVLAVCAFGTPPPAETRLRWEDTCRSADLPLIIDSAAGFGAVADDGTLVGAQGDLEVVSFHATKPFAIGEGGAVFTRNRILRDRVELAINFGLAPDHSVILERGLNGKMSELHAATGLAVLDEFDTILNRRRNAATIVRSLAPPSITWQDGCGHPTWQFLPVAFPDCTSRTRSANAHNAQVEVRAYYEPLHQMTPFTHFPVVDGDLSQTVALHDRILCLPMANDLTDAEIRMIAAVLEHERRATPDSGAILK
jgi:dTDP-4-amino-4,6-dideoxygalactose transaminase